MAVIGNSQNILRVFFACLLTVCLQSGCGQQAAVDSSEVLDESWFSMKDDEKPAGDAPATAEQAKVVLGVQLRQGDRFPLQKTVRKSLTQLTNQGPVESVEEVELSMAVTVEEIREQNKKIRIQYNRVKYSSLLNGQKTDYDSSAPSPNIPDHVLAYHGMINNGFSFWVGPDNQITEVVDFHNFLQRCLTHVPPQKANQTALVLANYSGQQNGIANFVDDTIGLLPYDAEAPAGGQMVRLGGNWSRAQHFNDPVPLILDNTYTLRELNDDYAKVDIMGKIAPVVGVSSPQQGVSLQIRGGHAVGTCTIDLKTGLPLDSHVDHQLDMIVQMNGVQMEQQKRVVTTIRMFLEQDTGKVRPVTAGHHVQHSAAETNVTPASFTQQ